MVRALTRSDARTLIAELRLQLDAVLDEIDAQRRNTTLSIEHQSFLNDYAAVRIAGYLEQLCFHAISGRVGEVTEGHMQEFVNSWFYKAPNLTPEQLRGIMGRFGRDVDLRVKGFLEEGVNREVLTSLLETRNAVAHGKEYSRTGRANLETFRALLDEIESLVKALLLDDASLI